MDAKQLKTWGIIGGIGALLMVLVAKRKSVISFGKLVFDAAKKAAFTKLLDPAAQPFASSILLVAEQQNVNPLLIVSFMWRESQYGKQLDPRGTGGYGDKTPRVKASWWPSNLPLREVGKNAKGQTLYMPPSPHLGWGFGLMQVDWASNHEWLSKNDWKDPYSNMTKGVMILKNKMKFFQITPSAADKANGDPRPLTGDRLIEASVAAYNTGEGSVLNSLKAGKPVDTTTADGNYSGAVLAMGARLQ